MGEPRHDFALNRVKWKQKPPTWPSCIPMSLTIVARMFSSRMVRVTKESLSVFCLATGSGEPTLFTIWHWAHSPSAVCMPDHSQSSSASMAIWQTWNQASFPLKNAVSHPSLFLPGPKLPGNASLWQHLSGSGDKTSYQDCCAKKHCIEFVKMLVKLKPTEPFTNTKKKSLP